MKITAREALNAGADLTTAQLAELLGMTRAGVSHRMRAENCKPVRGGGKGTVCEWAPEDYCKAFPLLDAVRGKA